MLQQLSNAIIPGPAAAFTPCVALEPAAPPAAPLAALLSPPINPAVPAANAPPKRACWADCPCRSPIPKLAAPIIAI